MNRGSLLVLSLLVFSVATLAEDLATNAADPGIEVSETTAADESAGEKGLWSAFVASISMILVSELGDKTFFIAAIMAMSNPRGIIFAGAIVALGIMTVLSVAMGGILPRLLPHKYTHFAATILFFIFGVRLLYDASKMEAGKYNAEEMEEVEEDLKAKEAIELEAGHKTEFQRTWKIFVSCLTMTFLAEWGDRSQIATIAMAARMNPFGVTIGGTLGHAICTAMAVIGGRILATRISEKTVATVGGILFLIFGVHALVFDSPEGAQIF